MKILVFTKNWLGDILFELPALERLRAEFPDAEIFCAGPERCREILERQPSVTGFIPFDEKSQHRSFFAKLKFAADLRKLRIDRAYLFHRSRTRAFLLMLAGIRERIGYGRSFLLTRSIAEPQQPMHHVDYFLNLLAESGIARSGDESYRFHFSEQDEKAAQEILMENQMTNFAAFHLGANWEPKRWPPAHFAQLADLIHERFGLPIILTGSAGDQPLEKEFFQHLKKSKVTSLIGKTGLGTLAALFSKAAFVVSGDSGPMHIASGVGTPIVALFGPTNPDLTGPRGAGKKIVLRYVPEGYTSPWYGKHLPEDGWLSKIRPEEVMQELEHRAWSKEHGADKNPMPHAPSSMRVLVITLSNIGDVILTTPVITALAAQYPGAEISVMVGPRAQNVLRGSRLIHELIIYDKKSSLASKLQLIKRLRKTEFDCVVDLRHTAIPYLIRAKKKSPLFRHYAPNTSFREKHLSVIRKMGIAAAPIPFDFFTEAEEKNLLQRLQYEGVSQDRGWIAVAPVALSDVKTWPQRYFAEVIQGLLEQRSEDILLIGSETDRAKIQPLVNLNPRRIFNFAGRTGLREAAALIANSSVLLANDSSLLQMAFEMNCYSVSMFGPTNIAKSGRTGERFRVLSEQVPCSPCEAAQCRFERQACFEDLKPSRVLAACLELLRERDQSQIGAPR